MREEQKPECLSNSRTIDASGFEGRKWCARLGFDYVAVLGTFGTKPNVQATRPQRVSLELSSTYFTKIIFFLKKSSKKLFVILLRP